MSIKVNSTEHEWVEGETVTALLRRMNFIYPMVVVRISGKVVPKSQYDSRTIPDGSIVEVMHLESGG